MKKLFILFMSLLIISLASCTEVSTETSATTTETTTAQTTTETTTIATTEFTYDPRSLVSDSCDHLENIDDWQPVWCDEFNYDGLPNSDLWSYDVGGGGWGNGEYQYYTNADLDNANVSDGTLKITAIKEDYMGSEYTSARMVSKYKGDFLYGKIQIRAKLPVSVGTWAALWMLPTDWRYGGWPDSGEIDIMEFVGKDPTHIYGTIHTAANNHNLGNQIGYSKTLLDLETEFHVYELEWEPGRMQVYVDGESYGTFGYNPLYYVDVDNEDAWPFDQRFHLIMNLAIGGSWGGPNVDDEAFPTSMEVDYVRVYQKDYAGMDQEDPSPVTELSPLKTEADFIKIYWDKATDDIMVKEYEIYVNYELAGKTSLNAFKIDNLMPSTQYRIDVVTVDFAGNRSTEVTTNIMTKAMRTILGIIEAESYDYQVGIVREDTTDVTGDQQLTWIDDNDYMEYILFVPEGGRYQITYRIANAEEAGEIKLYGKSSLPLTTTAIPVTGADNIWMDVTSNGFNLAEGIYTFTIKASIGGFKLNYFEFEKVE